MDVFFALLPTWIVKLAWPFLRILSALIVSPVLGDMNMPLRARVATALVIAFTALPAITGSPVVDPLSIHGIALVAEQILIGALFGLMFHLVLSAFMAGGFVIASQFGFAMAVINDPQNGTSFDVISQFLYVLFTMLFLAMDGHLLVVQVVYASFHAWPVGSGLSDASLTEFVRLVAWTLSAAVMLALPTVFAATVVQIGMGFIGRAVPSLNVFQLAFSLSIIVGLFTLGHLVYTIPEQYARMTEHLLACIGRQFGASHG
ncbi:flagellar biosynthetic protein FliR [Burkholderia ubonensis]|uniref:flagellar biosynthetic protein FliR n=1 Tax=Burkholderia ubonensis TaxID=101571 RepID=UPI000758D819|nr:flagellar biosynthetic protein FliR [Burkholderia ubonensis]KWB79400.1 hypothetical protein WL42_12625 [Burkholderia ubonensis]